MSAAVGLSSGPAVERRAASRGPQGDGRAGLERALLAAERQGGRDVYAGAFWFGVFLDTCIDAGDRVLGHALRTASGTLVPLPLRLRRRSANGLRWTALESLTTWYSCRFDLPGLDDSDAVTAWAQELAASPDRPVEILLECLDPASPAFTALRSGLRRAGWRVAAAPMFTTRYADLRPWRAAGGFAAYWEARPSALRRTVERKRKALLRLPGATLTITRDAARAADLVAAYEGVHARSWKPAEPYPAFMPTLIERGLHAGHVTVGLAHVGSEPVAAQVWLHGAGRATIFKLSYIEAAKALSAGSVLTAAMLEDAFARDDIDVVDFGWGDDAYKRDWLPDATERWQLVAHDPRTPAGLALATRTVVRSLRARARALRPHLATLLPFLGA